MTLSGFSALLIDAPVGRHFAQLHRSQGSLSVSVDLFVREGIRRGRGVVVIVGADTRNSISRGLATDGMNTAELEAQGRLVIADAAETLGTFMMSGAPDWDRFRGRIGRMLESVSQASNGGAPRMYGEVVNVLWGSGQANAAIRLEEYWNALGRMYPFSLFCGYTIESHSEACYAEPLHEIGRTHSDVLEGPDDREFAESLDIACKDVFGIALSEMLSLSGREAAAGEHRLPRGHRMMHWIARHMPGSASKVLDRARRHYRTTPSGMRALS